jgi:tetratricopeptide (TPR) repeat protein
MRKAVTPQLEANVHQALGLYRTTDQYQFTIALQNVLVDMINVRGGATYSGAVLQLAADAMGSEIQLMENDPGNNNYMLDQMTANIWFDLGHNENAETKYKEALKDIESMAFPGEEEKAMAQVPIYNRLAWIYDRKGQLTNVIAYHRAAVALAGQNQGSRFLACRAFYKLQRYDDAIKECTDVLNSGEDIETLWWRGKAYKEKNKPDLALADFFRIADQRLGKAQDDWGFGSAAVVEISVIYGEQNKIRKMLEVLNKYPYIYNEKMQSKNYLAVAYNNRCYAYMQLGELEKAYDDCSTSLRYDTIPDAYQKQQELVKRLKVKEKGL